MTTGRRAPRISQADVFQAADALLVEGHRPTIDRVRMRLGRGFPNTINNHLDAWWSKLRTRLRDLPGREQLASTKFRNVLKLMSRVAPRFIFKQPSKSADSMLYGPPGTV